MPEWKYKKLTFAGLILFAALTILDITSTTFIISAGGVELNPVMAPVIQFIAPIKAAALILIASIAVHCEQARPGIGPVVFLFAALVTGAAVTHNYEQMIISGVI